MILDRCATVDEALALIQQVPHAQSRNYLLADRYGQAVDCQALCTFPLAASWILIYRTLVSSFSVPYEFHIPLLALPYSAMVFSMGYRSLGSGANYRRTAVILAVVVFCCVFP